MKQIMFTLSGVPGNHIDAPSIACVINLLNIIVYNLDLSTFFLRIGIFLIFIYLSLVGLLCECCRMSLLSFVSNSRLISLSLDLGGRVVTKRTDINFGKSQPLFDVNQQFLWTLLIDLQANVLKFRCGIFHYFVYFTNIARFS